MRVEGSENRPGGTLGGQGANAWNPRGDGGGSDGGGRHGLGGERRETASGTLPACLEPRPPESGGTS